MPIILDWKGLESALINRTGPISGPISVPSFAVSHGEPVHELREFVVARGPGDQMKMVGHDAVREHAKRHVGLRLGKDADEGVIVGGMIEQAGAADGSIQNMKNKTGGSFADSSGHAAP